jgi:hypothetical protein
MDAHNTLMCISRLFIPFHRFRFFGCVSLCMNLGVVLEQRSKVRVPCGAIYPKIASAPPSKVENAPSRMGSACILHSQRTLRLIAMRARSSIPNPPRCSGRQTLDQFFCIRAYKVAWGMCVCVHAQLHTQGNHKFILVLYHAICILQIL